jgi:hypothetical protein
MPVPDRHKHAGADPLPSAACSAARASREVDRWVWGVPQQNLAAASTTIDDSIHTVATFREAVAVSPVLLSSAANNACPGASGEGVAAGSRQETHARPAKKHERNACDGERDQTGSRDCGKNDIDVACQPEGERYGSTGDNRLPIRWTSSVSWPEKTMR